MTRLSFIFFLLLLSTASAQRSVQESIVELQDIFAKNLGRVPHRNFEQRLATITAPELQATVSYFLAVLRGDAALDSRCLTLPDTLTLKLIWAVDSVHQTGSYRSHSQRLHIATAALQSTVDIRRLVSTYYQIIFVAVGNKMQPLDLSSFDFEPLRLTANDKQLATIFYLEFLRFVEGQTRGYILYVDPPNYDRALDQLEKLPKFNGKPYYAYTDLILDSFFDYFDAKWDDYKPYYVFKVYQVLSYHIFSLRNVRPESNAWRQIVSQSIVSKHEYYDFFDNADFLKTLVREATLR